MPLRVQVRGFNSPNYAERSRLVQALRRSPEDRMEADMRERFILEQGRSDVEDDGFAGPQTGLTKPELMTEMMGLIDALKSGDISSYPYYDDMVSDFAEAFPDDPLLEELEAAEDEYRSR